MGDLEASGHKRQEPRKGVGRVEVGGGGAGPERKKNSEGPGLPSVAAGGSSIFLLYLPWEAWRRPREESFGTYSLFQLSLELGEEPGVHLIPSPSPT